MDSHWFCNLFFISDNEFGPWLNTWENFQFRNLLNINPRHLFCLFIKNDINIHDFIIKFIRSHDNIVIWCGSLSDLNTNQILLYSRNFFSNLTHYSSDMNILFLDFWYLIWYNLHMIARNNIFFKEYFRNLFRNYCCLLNNNLLSYFIVLSKYSLFFICFRGFIDHDNILKIFMINDFRFTWD